MNRILIVCAIAFSLLSGGQRLVGADADPGVGEVAPATKKAKRMPFYGTVKAVDVEAMTFTLVGKSKDRLFLVTDTTRVHDAGEVCQLGDVVVGRKVGGVATQNPEGKWEVTTLNLGVKQQRGSSAKKVDGESSDG
jgi:hypothetical protein